jgi:hypothetical protein
MILDRLRSSSLFFSAANRLISMLALQSRFTNSRRLLPLVELMIASIASTGAVNHSTVSSVAHLLLFPFLRYLLFFAPCSARRAICPTTQ